MTDHSTPAAAGPAPPRTFTEAVSTCLGKYAVFSGRASRSEFWYFTLAAVLINLAVTVLSAALFADVPETGALLSLAVGVALVVPVVAAGVRRLHDTGRSGWWYLMALIPIANLALLVLLAEPPTPGPHLGTGLPAPPVESTATTAPQPAVPTPSPSPPPPSPQRDGGRFVAVWLAVGVLTLSNVAGWVLVATLWQDRNDTQSATEGESVASELRAADRRIEQLETEMGEARFGSDLTALRVQAFVECVNTYMRVVGDSRGGPYRYNFCR